MPVIVVIIIHKDEWHFLTLFQRVVNDILPHGRCTHIPDFRPLLNKDLDGILPNVSTGVDEDRVLIGSETSAEQLLIDEVKGDVASGSDVD